MDLQSIISYSLLIPSLIGAVKDAVLLFEVPGESGPDKSKKVVAYIEKKLPEWLPGNQTAEDVAKVLALVQPLIDLYVSIFNKPGGVFAEAPKVTAPAPAPAPPVENKEQLTAHIANMKRRLAEFQAGSAADKDAHIANLTKNIADAEAKLAALQ